MKKTINIIFMDKRQTTEKQDHRKQNNVEFINLK